MKNIPAFFLVLVALFHIPVASRAQLPETGESSVRPIPEIKRLYEAFAGDWGTSEQGNGRSFFRMAANARAERMCVWRPAAPCWRWKATRTARPDR
jgi:hypothetical protein